MSQNFDYDNFISPCKDICRMDVDNQYCIGCKRTRDEIKNWKFYNKEKKLQIMNGLKTRD